ncbi:MAG TPA: Rieske 2Fe-2S domain-containing protein [Micromonosporaceae bacterium]|nr:Rieske 2Fe-2S domain-containing protein [Micromonosporaceae bacterium]
MSTHSGLHAAEADNEEFDHTDPRLSRFDLVKEGARRDGVQLVYYAPRFPVPGTRREARVVRAVGLLFFLSGLFATAFVVAYIWWPWRYQDGSNLSKLYTPVLGVSLGLSLACLGLGFVAWGKKLLPEEIAVQDRHDGGSPADEKKLTGETMLNMVDELGIKRRPLLAKTALLGMLPLGAVAVAPLIGGLIKNPHKPDILFHTGWDPSLNSGHPIAVCREDGTKIRPEDVSIGGQMTVFPGIFNTDGDFVGASNDFADSPTLLIHLRQDDAQVLRSNLVHVPINEQNTWGNFVAYSKICTHAGCPASLYEQQTNRLLCPCHQSQFNILDNARPIFGPATRRLPMLPLTVADDGFFYAKSDYQVPVGPGFWERP